MQIIDIILSNIRDRSDLILLAYNLHVGNLGWQEYWSIYYLIRVFISQIKVIAVDCNVIKWRYELMTDQIGYKIDCKGL